MKKITPKGKTEVNLFRTGNLNIHINIYIHIYTQIIKMVSGN